MPAGFIAQLLVVFIGVYGAFWVEGYWQKQEDRERAATILGALNEELLYFVDEAPIVVDGIRRVLDEYDSAREAGRFPAPPFYRESGAETPPISVWKATLSSGAVDLLDPDLFFALAAHYNRVESASDRYVRYNSVTESEVLPLLSGGPAAFYDPETDDLAPRFGVHVEQLRTLRDEIQVLVVRADSLHGRVLADLDRMR
jgi:hypothetical protein